MSNYSATSTLPRSSAFLRMWRMQLKVEQILFWRNLSSVFFTFILPLAILVGVSFSKERVSLLPFVAAIAVLSIAFQGLSMQIAMHRDQGVLKRIMATPLPTTVLILGKISSIFLIVLLELMVILGVGVFWFNAQFPAHPLLLITLVLFGTATFVTLGFALAAFIPSAESAPAIVNAAYLATVAVGVLVNTIHPPHVWQLVVSVFAPLYALSELFNAAWLSGFSQEHWGSGIILGVWLSVSLMYTKTRFRWEPKDEQ